MNELIVFYWIFAFAFLAGYSYRQNNRLKFITCILLFIIAGLLFPFMLGMSFYEKKIQVMKIETKYSLYDAVWFMWNNKAVCRNISRVYTWVDKEEQYETYDVQCDGEDDCHLSEYTFELDELFPTKEELLKSL